MSATDPTLSDRPGTTLQLVANAALEAKAAAMEAHGMMGEAMRELANLGKRVDRLSDKVDTLLLRGHSTYPPPQQAPNVSMTTGAPHARAKMDSVSDFDREITLNGTEYLRLTPAQVESIIDERIRKKQEQDQLQDAAAPVLWFKGNAAKFVVAMGVAIAGAIGAGLAAGAKLVWTKLSH